MLETELRNHGQQQDGVDDQIDGAVISNRKNPCKERERDKSQEHDGHAPAQIVGRVPVKGLERAHGNDNLELFVFLRTSRFFAVPYEYRIFISLTKLGAA